MKIVLDFDDTIFNTYGLLRDFLEVYKKVGFKEEEFYIGYEKVKKRFKDFDLKLIAGMLYDLKQFDKNKVEKEIGHILERTDLHVYPDFIAFAESFEKEDLMLLSYGTTEFQKEKIERSKIIPLLSEITITKNDKAEDFKNIIWKYGNEKVFFIDDRADQIDSVKENFPQVITLKMEKSQGRYIGSKSKLTDYVVKDFYEAKDIILRT